MASTATQPALALLQNFHAKAAGGKATYDAIAALIVDIEALQTQDSTGTYTCIAGDAVGNVVYISAANTVALADADDAAKRPAIGVITAKPTPTALTCTVQFFGEVTGLTGLTAGAAYYLSTTAGDMTATPPAGNVQLLGYAKSTTILHLIPAAIAFLLSSTAASLGASLIGLQDVATIYTATNVEAALAEVKVLADAGVALQKRSLTADHTTITTAGASQTINIGATLPANARILGVSIHDVTAFSGGTVGDFTVDIGSSGDPDAIVDGANLFAAAVDGQVATMPDGIAPNKLFATIGAQLTATFACGSDDVADASAGSCIIDVLFTVLA